MDKLLITIIAVFLVGGSAYFIFQNQKQNPGNNPGPSEQITNFAECMAAGNPVAESYPRPADGEARPAGRQCNTPDGKHFVENIGNTNEMDSQIVVVNPLPNEIIKTPLTIVGKARGTWFFEAQFPIKIVDANNKELGSTVAHAASDWMTDDFVPFTATLTFGTSTAEGNLIFKNDNPSGLPANNKQLAIPVKFF